VGAVGFPDVSGKNAGFLLFFNDETQLLAMAFMIPREHFSFREAKQRLRKWCKSGKSLEKDNFVFYQDCRLVLMRGDGDRLAGFGVY
jgi:hypothetical protein